MGMVIAVYVILFLVAMGFIFNLEIRTVYGFFKECRDIDYPLTWDAYIAFRQEEHEAIKRKADLKKILDHFDGLLTELNNADYVTAFNVQTEIQNRLDYKLYIHQELEQQVYQSVRNLAGYISANGIVDLVKGR